MYTPPFPVIRSAAKPVACELLDDGTLFSSIAFTDLGSTDGLPSAFAFSSSAFRL